MGRVRTRVVQHHWVETKNIDSTSPLVRQLYEKVERMLDRDVANTAASDRPVFTTDEKHYHSDEKREPKKMTELCAELHRRNKLTSEAKKNSE